MSVKLGLSINLCDPAIIEMAGWIGYQFVWIDCEHTLFANLGELVRAAMRERTVKPLQNGECLARAKRQPVRVGFRARAGIAETSLKLQLAVVGEAWIVDVHRRQHDRRARAVRLRRRW